MLNVCGSGGRGYSEYELIYRRTWKKLVQLGIIFTGCSQQSSPTKVLSTPNVLAAYCCHVQWYGLQVGSVLKWHDTVNQPFQPFSDFVCLDVGRNKQVS